MKLDKCKKIIEKALNDTGSFLVTDTAEDKDYKEGFEDKNIKDLMHNFICAGADHEEVFVVTVTKIK